MVVFCLKKQPLRAATTVQRFEFVLKYANKWRIFYIFVGKKDDGELTILYVDNYSR